MPPCPMTRSTRYLPSRTVPTSKGRARALSAAGLCSSDRPTTYLTMHTLTHSDPQAAQAFVAHPEALALIQLVSCSFSTTWSSAYCLVDNDRRSQCTPRPNARSRKLGARRGRQCACLVKRAGHRSAALTGPANVSCDRARVCASSTPLAGALVRCQARARCAPRRGHVRRSSLWHSRPWLRQPMSRNQATQRRGLVRTKKGEGCYDAGCIEGDFD